PIPEYQLELGGSAQPPGIIRSLGLWLHLRNNASLLNVRINGVSGEVATLEAVDAERFRREHGDVMSGVAQILHTAFSQLQGKLPGTYILRHARLCHGILIWGNGADIGTILLGLFARSMKRVRERH
ncbi:jg23293, partial [Pararge aegeria aegeria]